MKGIVFTELLEMVEDRFGYEVVDQVLDSAQLVSGGAYTAVGSYPHAEMVEILRHLSEATGLSADELLVAYGEHLFDVFTKAYHQFFENETSALDFLAKIEDKIHPQVLKLYPDAELPTFEIIRHASDRLQMTYISKRQMGKFAEGLIYGCLKHFKEAAQVLSESLDNGTKVRFTITR